MITQTNKKTTSYLKIIKILKHTHKTTNISNYIFHNSQIKIKHNYNIN